jgi:hypothetical protein
VNLAEPAHITAYLNLTTLDGRVNENQRENLQRALGWSGKTLRELRDGDFSAIDVEIVIEDDNGKLRVEWIQSLAGNLRKASDADLATMEAKWAAANGGTSTADDPAADPEIPF